MTREDARLAALDWLRAEGRSVPGYAGAYLSGSWLEAAPGSPWPEDSDVDVVALCGADAPSARKLRWGGVLIEATYLDAAVLANREQLLDVHYLAYALFHGEILDDPAGLLAPLRAFVRAEYLRPERLRSRWRAMLEEMRRGVRSFDPSSPLHVQAMGFLFTAGKCPFPPLIALGRNCTVRKRYPALRAALEPLGLEGLMPELYRPLLGADFDPSCLPGHVNALERAFNDACASSGPSADYRFRGDISPEARSLSVLWCRKQLKTAHPEDCAFWLGAAFARSLTVLALDGSPLYAGHARAFEAFLASLGVPDEAAMASRLAELEALLPRLDELSEAVRARQADVYGNLTSPNP